MPAVRTAIVVGLLTVTVVAVIGWGVSRQGAGRPGSPAVPRDEIGPSEIPERPGRRVNSAAELDALLRDRLFTGRVIIPKDAVWKMERCDQQRDGDAVCTPMREIPLYDGVQLVGERGDLGQRPLLFTTIVPTDRAALFEVCGNDVLVQGLHLQGPQRGEDHEREDPYVHGIRVWQNTEDGTVVRCAADNAVGVDVRVGKIGQRVVIVDNELDQWTGGAVSVIGGHANVPLSEWTGHLCPGNPDCCAQVVADGSACWLPPTPADAGQLRVERNFVHHNARDDGGYGVDVNGGAYVTIEGNVFNYNRHAVTATGMGHSGYVARFNYVLQGGYRQGGSWTSSGYYNQHFDVHGEEDGDGGAAGTYFEIAFNTVRGEQGYYVTETRAAFWQRGIPAVGVDFMSNVLAHDSLGDAVKFKRFAGAGPAQDPVVRTRARFREGGNRFDTDHAADLAVGDFDGDGRTDVFIANGTGWFYSRAGRGAWEFLHASNKRLDELGFADIDNDGITDVLYRDGAGNLGYLGGGRKALEPLTWIPVAMKDLRVGDFDGDGKTDLFFILSGQWQVWSGANRAWTWVQTSSKGISELLFGEFDDVKGTDVATVLQGGWAYSSGATRAWIPLNSRLTDSFANAVAADFDGNGKTDIAFSHGPGWQVSLDGRAGAAVLVDGGLKLDRWLVGRFEGGTRSMALHFGPPVSPTSKRFVVWRGLGSGNSLHPWSEHEMQ